MPFSDIIGQERAVSILKGELLRKRIPHAYLFTGTEGIGKKRTAISLAMAIQCGRVEADSCGCCPDCRKVTAGSHPDVRIYTPTARTKGATEKIYVDQIRALQGEISLSPMQGPGKVFIIDEADRMVEQAANALLKTLEEPPDDSLLILVSANPARLPSTILSRCRPVRFQSLSEHAVGQILMRERGIPEETADALARFSQGRLGQVLERDLSELLATRDRFLEGLSRCDRRRMETIFEFSEMFNKNTPEALELIEFLQGYVRDLIAVKLTGPKGALIHADRGGDLVAESRSRSLSGLLEDFDLLEEADRRLRKNTNARLVLENLLVRIGIVKRHSRMGRIDHE